MNLKSLVESMTGHPQGLDSDPFPLQFFRSVLKLILQYHSDCWTLCQEPFAHTMLHEISRLASASHIASGKLQRWEKETNLFGRNAFAIYAEPCQLHKHVCLSGEDKAFGLGPNADRWRALGTAPCRDQPHTSCTGKTQPWLLIFDTKSLGVLRSPHPDF